MDMMLRNAEIRVTGAQVTDAEWESGPDDNRTVEPVKEVVVRFDPDHSPYTRRGWGNMLTEEGDAQLLRVESVQFRYHYDHEFGGWWAPSIRVAAVFANEWGLDFVPREEQPMGCWGESAKGTPQWVKDEVEKHRPPSGEVPAKPRKVSRV